MPDSFITRCPNCKTCFRVGEAQLASRQGQVRCGRCAFVFAAPDHRVAADPPAPVPDLAVAPPAPAPAPPTAAPAPDPVPPVVAVPATATEFADTAATDRVVANDAPLADPPLADPPLDGPPPEDPPRQYELPLEIPAEPPAAPQESVNVEPAAIAAAAVQPTEASAEPPASAPVAAKETIDVEETAAEETVNAEESVAAADEPAAPAIVEPVVTPSPDLLTDYQVAAAGKNTGVDFTAKPVSLFEKPRRGPVWLWALGCLVLIVLAVGQVAREYRGDLLLSHPELRPHLQMLCDYTHCTLDLPRKIEWITIEASDLQNLPDNPRHAILNAVIRNRAGFTQALPKLELALTDPQDQAMVRRAIPPSEYLPKKVEAALAAGQEIAVKVHIDLKDVQASGYRLALFY